MGDALFMINRYKLDECPEGCEREKWAKCPYIHLEEPNQRRDFKLHFYNSTRCLHMLQYKQCPDGDQCEDSHGYNEHYYHPEIYKTQPCLKPKCTSGFCPFAHNDDEVRVVTSQSDNQPQIQRPRVWANAGPIFVSRTNSGVQQKNDSPAAPPYQPRSDDPSRQPDETRPRDRRRSTARLPRPPNSGVQQQYGPPAAPPYQPRSDDPSRQPDETRPRDSRRSTTRPPRPPNSGVISRPDLAEAFPKRKKPKHGEGSSSS